MPLFWHIRDRVLDLTPRCLILGIVNVTPDSFSDGGRHAGTQAAVEHALRLAQQGGDLLDIGGESTRPGSQPVPLDEELARVLPVVAALRKKTDVPLSIDTSKAEVARRCLDLGAHIINDVTALTGDPDMPAVVRDSGAGAILMHMQGTPATMDLDPRYDDVVAEVRAFFEKRLHDLLSIGIAADKLVLDPGIGFGKRTVHSLTLLAHPGTLAALGRPICLGVSRKGFLGKITGRAIDERATASALVGFYGVMRGGAHILRVHDVAETRDAVLLAQALKEAKTGDVLC